MSVSYRDIIRHRANGLSLRNVAAACSCAPSTVQEVISLANKKGVGWSDVANLSEEEAYELIRGKPRQDETFFPVDCEYIFKEKSRDGTMRLTILWEEYCANSALSGRKPYKYSKYCDIYRAWCERNDVAMIKNYIPGEVGEFDYAGKTMEVVDPMTGETSTAYLFVACLPFSQKTFVRAYPSMKSEWWIKASMDAFAYFGGAPRLLTIDNLKVGVSKNTSTELVLNRAYREFAEYYNVAVIPHKPYGPSGKASVESSVDKIANRIRSMLRDRRFFSFDELNDAISGLLATLNAKPFQKREGSRDSVFEEKERRLLQPLPSKPYEISHWGVKGKIPRNYHVKCVLDGTFYSVPYRYVGQEAEVRTTANVVEVFVDGARIATHARDRGKQPGGRITDPIHLKKSHSDYLTHDSDHFRTEAAKVGPACSRVIEGFLSDGIAEEQGRRWCERLLRMLEGHSPQTLEDVCARALQIVPNPSYKAINTLMRNRDDVADARGTAKRPPDSLGALYRFKKKEKQRC